MNLLVLCTGLILLAFIIYDFFFTTLSGSGAGFISKSVAGFTYKMLRRFSKPTNRKVFNYSGMVVNLSVLLVWILIVWIGLFMVYSYAPEGITNSSSRPANWVERLYFTGYILSTLGLGNFKPTTPFFEIVTSIFSFFGFIFFTSAMTYLISISSALIRKRTLSRSISNLGNSPSKMAAKIGNLNQTYREQIMLTLQDEFDRHLVSHQAYPVVHFFSHQNPEHCFNLNFVRLDEALSILLEPESRENSNIPQKEELTLLRGSMTSLLEHLQQNFAASLPEQSSTGKNIDQIDLLNLNQRRKLLSSLLESEGFTWKVVEGS